jgi:UDP-N-acetylglucosamine:LPS N-acetylglucosamine transferase
MRVTFAANSESANIYLCLAIAEQFGAEQNWDFEKIISGDIKEQDEWFAQLKAIKNERSQAANKTHLFYIGNARSYEEKLIARIPFLNFLNLPKLVKPRTTSSIYDTIVEFLAWFVKLSSHVRIAIRKLKISRTEFVFAIGCYQTIPILIACIILNIKFFILNPNANYSLTTKIFKAWAHKVFLGFPMKEESEKIIYTGNPILKSYFKDDKELEQQQAEILRPTNHQKLNIVKVVIYGGETGHTHINDLVGDVLDRIHELEQRLYQKRIELKICHFVGPYFYEEHTSYYLQDNLYKYPFYRVYRQPFNLSDRFKEADICICNASALNISLAGVTNTATILMPKGISDMEKANAQAFEDASAAYVIHQFQGNKERQKDRLMYFLENLCCNSVSLEQLRRNLSELSEFTSALKIFNYICEDY